MDFLFHFAQDSPRFLPINIILCGLISHDFYLISMGILSIGNSIINLILKQTFKILYSITNQKSLPLLGIGERPMGGYKLNTIGCFDKYTSEAKLFGMPSGHAQSAWFFAIFGIMYLIDNNKNKNKNKNRIIIIFTTLSLITIASFISFSRVYNNCHTTEQVILGSLIGSFFGFYGYKMVKYILERIK
jgi:membrane-associated phospholipid phosphatase